MAKIYERVNIGDKGSKRGFCILQMTITSVVDAPDRTEEVREVIKKALDVYRMQGHAFHSEPDVSWGDVFFRVNAQTKKFVDDYLYDKYYDSDFKPSYDEFIMDLVRGKIDREE